MKIDVEQIINNLISKARALFNDKEKLGGILDKAKGIIQNNKELKELFDDIKLLIQLVGDYKNGVYKGISNSSIIIVLAGLIYLVTPIDLLPDFILGGFIDDAAVIAYIIKKISVELTEYKEWKEAHIHEGHNDNDDFYDHEYDNMIEITLDDDDVEEI
jgi:uncharacterized membrane protein YkvA (DUF1232 family)